MTCPICAGERWVCPVCKKPITTHSHENDYICGTHGFVSPESEDGRFELVDSGSGNVPVVRRLPHERTR